jgi:hypothetical protein
MNRFEFEVPVMRGVRTMVNVKGAELVRFYGSYGKSKS